MSLRVTSEVFVGALVRRTRAAGGFAYVARKGNPQAGAVFIAFHDASNGSYALYQTAPPALDGDAAERDARRFIHARTLEGDEQLRAMVESEARFDPDFWLIEIENWSGPVSELLAIDDLP